MAITSPVSLPTDHPFAGRNVATVFADRVAVYGDRRFLAWEPTPGDGDADTWTYAEFGAMVERVAAGLVARGVGRGDAVMLLLENSPAFLACWFACARVGAVAVDTNVRYAADEIEHAVSLTNPVGLVTHDQLRERCEGWIDDVWVVTVDERTGTVPDLEVVDAAAPTTHLDPADPLCIQFTSGTTSRPKAALYTHANALWAGQVGVAHGRVDSADVAFVHAPLFHTMALFWQTVPAFWAGASVVLAPKYSSSQFWDISVRHGCTRTFMLALIAGIDGEVPPHAYRYWIAGAEMPAVEERFGIRCQSAWGMTEVVTNVLAGDLDVPGTPGTIGRVTPEYAIRVVPVADARDDPDEGELRVAGTRGISLFAGYHNNPEATADGFDDDGYWCTGDLVRRLPTGEIQFVSRIKDMLRVAGENVAAAEIERVLIEHPAVRGAAVVGHPDPMRGELPVGFVVAASDDAAALGAELIKRCSERLADFKVPRRVHIIDEMPESLIGKTSKKSLRERSVQLGLGD